MKSSYEALGNYIRLIDVRNSENVSDKVLGISIDKYFMPSVANIIGTDLSRYKLISKGLFACNPMHVGRDERLPVALYKDDEPALVSPAYFMFEIIDNAKLNADYLMMWFRRSEFDRNCWLKTDGSVRGGITWEDFCRIEVFVPPIEEQKKIVNNYQIITKRIELKKKINDNLELQVNTLYKKLVQSQDNNSIFSEIAIIESGKRPISTNRGNFKLIGAGGIMGNIDVFNYDEPILVTGRVGTHGAIQRLFSKCWASDNTLIIKSKYYEFSYNFLKSIDWSLLNRGSTQPLVTQTDIKNLPLYIPPKEKLNYFEEIAKKIMKNYENNNLEIEKLENLKNLLISRLSS